MRDLAGRYPYALSGVVVSALGEVAFAWSEDELDALSEGFEGAGRGAYVFRRDWDLHELSTELNAIVNRSISETVAGDNPTLDGDGNV